ncbi:MAG TPA: metallophosphoesterase [Anaerolineales bacterium]|nr:metallophosphoesterase [Anaerolineales bacterium]
MDHKSQSRRGFSRRDFLKLLKAATIEMSLLAAGGGGYGFWIEPNWLRVEEVNLKLRRLAPDFHGLRIAQVSDIHMGGWMNVERLQRVADAVIDQRPDLFLLTGDFLTGHTFDGTSEQHLQELITVLSPLAKSIPCYAVLGNHDYWTNAGAVREMLRSCGMIDLTNSVFTVTRGNERLYLCGVDDVWEGEVRLDQVIESLADDAPAILLAHEPDFADVSSRSRRFDLQLSGHSHGGQVVVPFYGPLVLPYLGQKYSSGLYQVGEMYQYTNRGVGMLDPPVRFNCPPEITLLTLDGNG